jgi:hypothetical protein
VAHERRPARVLHHGAVVHHQRERQAQALRNRFREVITPACHERDDDAGADGVGKGVAVRIGNLAAAVEQRAVDIDGQETNHE